MKIAIAGGTGLLGSCVVAAAQKNGHSVVVLTRSNGVDLVSGVGLAEHLIDVDAVIDVSNKNTLSKKNSVQFFQTVTRNLLAAEKLANVKHHVALSIVGIDEINSAYYAGKLAQEREIESSDVPFTIIRSTQFHEFASQQLAVTPGPVKVIPKCLTKPIAAREVADYLLKVAESKPKLATLNIGGPKDEILADLAKRQIKFDEINQLVIEVSLPGKFGRGMASGKLRGKAFDYLGKMTFDDWLKTQDHKPVK